MSSISMVGEASALTPLSDSGNHAARGIWLAKFRHRLHRMEDGLIAVVLMAMVVLPLAEILLRSTLRVGIASNAIIVQHLTLIVGMLGGAIAARESRLLALFGFQESRSAEQARGAARAFTGVAAASISLLLAVAGFQFVRVERLAGGTLAGGIPRWVIETALPAGFCAIAARAIVRLEGRPAMRGLLLAGAAGLVALAAWLGPSPIALVLGVVLLAASTLLGLPAFAVLGGVSLLSFWSLGQPLASIAVSHYSLATNPMLPSIPLFTLAGYFLAESRAPHRLVRVFYAMFGSMRGGPAVVTVLVCAFFTSFTGASGVTILALGGLLMPVLLESGYSEKDALGLVTGAGALGILLPPCLPLILYAIVARIPVQQMFLAGLLPACLLMAATAGWGILRGRKLNLPRRPFVWREARE
ncbi:MAG: TRAP transporter large permease subunit, partial [Acidobacteria bacterium]|nr:TRAP transporter large permease subunit [Acidobacteriota bacterium]